VGECCLIDLLDIKKLSVFLFDKFISILLLCFSSNPTSLVWVGAPCILLFSSLSSSLLSFPKASHSNFSPPSRFFRRSFSTTVFSGHHSLPSSATCLGQVTIYLFLYLFLVCVASIFIRTATLAESCTGVYARESDLYELNRWGTKSETLRRARNNPRRLLRRCNPASAEPPTVSPRRTLTLAMFPIISHITLVRSNWLRPNPRVPITLQSSSNASAPSPRSAAGTTTRQ